MDLASLATAASIRLPSCDSGSVLPMPDLPGLLVEGRLRTHPDDVVDRVVVAVERFLARVDIHQPYVVGTVQAEEV